MDLIPLGNILSNCNSKTPFNTANFEIMATLLLK